MFVHWEPKEGIKRKEKEEGEGEGEGEEGHEGHERGGGGEYE
jgi:hypothetical protein